MDLIQLIRFSSPCWPETMLHLHPYSSIATSDLAANFVTIHDSALVGDALHSTQVFK
jgi:hypothetical protein